MVRELVHLYISKTSEYRRSSIEREHRIRIRQGYHGSRLSVTVLEDRLSVTIIGGDYTVYVISSRGGATHAALSVIQLRC